MSTPEEQSIFSWKGVLLMVAVIVLGIYALFPQQKVMIERLIDSGEYERALEEIQKLPDSERLSDPIYFRSTELRLRRLYEVSHEDPEQWNILFNDALLYYQELRGAKLIREQILEIIPMLPDVNTAAEQFNKSAPSLYIDARRPIAEKLVLHALANVEQKLAAELYLKHALEPTPDANTLIELVRLRRLADQNETALAEIQEFLPKINADESDIQRLDSLRIDLLRSLNRPSEAFDILLTRFEDEPENVHQDAFFNLGSELSQQSDRQEEWIPAMEERLTIHADDHEKTFARYLNLLMATGRLDAARTALESRRAEGMATDEENLMLAQLYEWNSDPDRAFTLYDSLARAGNKQALDRMIDLNNGLYRHYELVDTLEQAIPILDNPQYKLYLARLLVQIGDYEKSTEYFKAYLASISKEDPDLYAEMADAYKTVYDFSKAIEAYRKALALNPERDKRITYLKNIAWLLSLEGNYDEAMVIYQKIHTEEQQDDILPSILSLASLTNDKETYYSTIEEILAKNPHDVADISDEKAMAKMFKADDHGAARKWRESLNQYRRDLAENYLQQKRFEEATHVIEGHSELYSDTRVFEFYLYTLLSAQNYKKAAEAIDSEKLNPALLKDPQIIETAAWVFDAVGQPLRALQYMEQLYVQFPESEIIALSYARMLAYNGSPSRAREILAPLLENNASPDIFRLAADISLASSNYQDAERYMIMYINAQSEPTGNDLSLLADIRLSRGDARGARETYNLALKKMLRSNPEFIR